MKVLHLSEYKKNWIARGDYVEQSLPYDQGEKGDAWCRDNVNDEDWARNRTWSWNKAYFLFHDPEIAQKFEKELKT